MSEQKKKQVTETEADRYESIVSYFFFNTEHRIHTACTRHV